MFSKELTWTLADCAQTFTEMGPRFGPSPGPHLVDWYRCCSAPRHLESNRAQIRSSRNDMWPNKDRLWINRPPARWNRTRIWSNWAQVCSNRYKLHNAAQYALQNASRSACAGGPRPTLAKFGRLRQTLAKLGRFGANLADVDQICLESERIWLEFDRIGLASAPYWAISAGVGPILAHIGLNSENCMSNVPER